MKVTLILVFACVFFSACTDKKSQEPANTGLPITGTWKLLSGTLIERGDTTFTEYNTNVSFIKILNDNHFAFLQHDTLKGKDSAAVFVAGGGAYTLHGDTYTEHLEYCSARAWEGHDFSFTVTIVNDTLTQRGVEKVPDQGIDRINIERYARLKQ